MQQTYKLFALTILLIALGKKIKNKPSGILVKSPGSNIFMSKTSSPDLNPKNMGHDKTKK